MSLDAAKIQEDQHEAADESSRAEVFARATASMLNKKKDALRMRQSNPNTKQLQAALKKASDRDHKALVDLGHINSESISSAANERASARHTAAEVQTGGNMITTIAQGLLPS